jgi:hypothetical protein
MEALTALLQMLEFESCKVTPIMVKKVTSLSGAMA